MACNTCSRNRKKNGYQQTGLLDCPPYEAADIFVIEKDTSYKINNSVWLENTKKILIFIEDTTNLQYNQSSIDLLKENNIQLFFISVYDKNYIEDDYIIKLNSYLLPAKMSLIYNGILKNVIIFVQTDGSLIQTEYFDDMLIDLDLYIKNIVDYIKGGGDASTTKE